MRVFVMLNFVFFLLLSLPTHCQEIDWCIENNIPCEDYMEDELFHLAMFELEMYPACNIFDNGDDYPWIEETTSDGCPYFREITCEDFSELEEEEDERNS